MKDIDYVIEILSATKNGKLLTSAEFKLVEFAHYRLLNSTGMKALRDLYRNVTGKTGEPLNKLHKSKTSQFGMCGAYAFRYKDKRSGAGVDDWKDANCYDCLKHKPQEIAA